MSLAPRIYICAAREDGAWCRAFVEALRWSGADVLESERDEDTAAPAQTSSQTAAQRADEIERALLTRPIFIAVLSPAATVAAPVRDAIEVAARRQRTELERILLAVAAATTAL